MIWCGVYQTNNFCYVYQFMIFYWTMKIQPNRFLLLVKQDCLFVGILQAKIDRCMCSVHVHSSAFSETLLSISKHRIMTDILSLLSIFCLKYHGFHSKTDFYGNYGRLINKSLLFYGRLLETDTTRLILLVCQ